jgi:hypothetical protein
MTRKITNVLLAALVVLNILDGDFINPSWLDFVKLGLFVICFALNNWRSEKDAKS